MRVEVKKFIFIGLENKKELFFKEAQELGIVQFLQSSDQKPTERSETIGKALKILSVYPDQEQESSGDAQSVLDLHKKQETLKSERKKLNKKLEKLEPFGEFDPQELLSIKVIKPRFYIVKSDQNSAESSILVNSSKDLDYFISLDGQISEKAEEVFFDASLATMKAQLSQIDKTLERVDAELKALGACRKVLKQQLSEELNAKALIEAASSVSQEDSLFAIEGWVPTSEVHLMEKMDVHFEEVLPNESEVVPTYLKNEGWSAMGQDLVSIYDTPSNNDKDPSLFVFLLFSLFFAIIIGDGGYGAVLLGLALYLRFANPTLKGAKKRFLNLLTVLGCASIVWGFLTTSFFGMTLNPDNPLRNVSIIQWLSEKHVAYRAVQNDAVYLEWLQSVPEGSSVLNSPDILAKLSDQVLFELSLLLGMLHIASGMVRNMRSNYPMFGWLLFLIGAYFYFPGYLDVPSFVNTLGGFSISAVMQVGQYLMAGGIGLAVVLSLIKNKWLGLVEITVVIQIFSDVLSYLRLYALGLAGSAMSGIINQAAGHLPFILGMVLLLFAHGINLVLGVMSGIIHGLRLNFLEWYHYAFEGGGKLFKPLKKVEIE